MPGKVWNDGSDEWQKHVVQLLKLHYGPTEFVEVPDKDRGDCGIEGFSRTGHAYQCYAAEEPLDTDGLLKKQQAKITKDLRKLSLNKTNFAAMLGQTVLCRWILIVPRWESRFLVEHAEKKAAEMRAKGLTFISSDFAVQILTAEDFAIENQSLVNEGLRIVRIDAQAASQPHISDWAQQDAQSNQYLQNLERKLRVFQLPDVDHQDLVHKMIGYFLTGQNVLQGLSNKYPEMHVRAKQEKSDHEQFLDTVTRLGSTSPNHTIISQMETFRQKLEKALPGISDHNINQLAWEAVADWLLRCPLEILTDNRP